MKKLTLVLNAGSSSLKWGVVHGDRVLHEGVVEGIGAHKTIVTVGRKSRVIPSLPTPVSALGAVVQELIRHNVNPNDITTVGHRVVHGGSNRKPLVLNGAALKQLAQLDHLAPLHNPSQRLVATAARRMFPQAKHVAAFDTAFYADLPVVAKTYAIPPAIAKKYGIQRYGFHGLAHPLTLATAAKQLRRPVNKLNAIILHLGSGCSVTATAKGKPVDTSMGMTPLEGLVMMTRAGDIDAGIFLMLLHEGWSANEIEKLLTRQSGIRGLTGATDMRDVLVSAGVRVPGWKAHRVSTKGAKLALDLFVYRIRKYLGAYGAVLGTVDAVIFTGAVGERSAPIRQLVMKNLVLPGRPRVLAVASSETMAIAQAIRP